MAKAHTDKGRRRLLVTMGALGALAGLLLALGATLLVEPKDAASAVAFWTLSVISGSVLGVAFALYASRAADRSLAGLLKEAHDRFGLSVDMSGTGEAMREETLRLLGDLTSVLSQVRAVNTDLRQLTAEVLAATEQQASAAAQQAAAVTETSATVEELAQTSKQIAENSQSVAAVAENTLASAEEGMQSVADTTAGIEDIRESNQVASDRILALGERSQEIGRVLVIIDDIAEQTKILALERCDRGGARRRGGEGLRGGRRGDPPARRLGHRIDVRDRPCGSRDPVQHLVAGHVHRTRSEQGG